MFVIATLTPSMLNSAIPQKYSFDLGFHNFAADLIVYWLSHNECSCSRNLAYQNRSIIPEFACN